jgi:ABC-type amino acid transport substrate-binding protein
LGVTIEFVPFAFGSLSEQLAADQFDIAMSGIYGTADRSGDIRFSDPYMFATMALVVPDHRDADFATPGSIRSLEKVRVGVHRSLEDEEAALSTTSGYPNVEFVVLDSYREFFEQRGAGEGLDALYTGAESGSAWTLLYPSFQVVTPWSDDYTIPLVYPYSGGEDNEMDEFIDHWVLLKQHDGTTERAYEHWILGKGGENRGQRWSVIRNVLGWVD